MNVNYIQTPQELRTCLRCSKRFEPRTYNNKYCSTDCRVLDRTRRWVERYRSSEHMRAGVREGNRKAFAQKRELVRELKNVPCTDCKQPYPYYVMDFDHREGEVKEFNLGFSHAGGAHDKKISDILEEAAKCDVVCSNCHRERTHRRKEASHA